jgi:hypothetical protein
MHRATLIPGDVEAIERATVAAVSPEAVEELDGWLLAFDTGTVGRAKSAAWNGCSCRSKVTMHPRWGYTIGPGLKARGDTSIGGVKLNCTIEESAPIRGLYMTVVTNIEDLRVLAKKRVPRMFYDYADSGSWTESTYRANEADFQKIKLRQRVAVNMENRSTRTQMIGVDVAMPVAIAPTGLTGMQHADGEILGARAAEQSGIPFTLSTMPPPRTHRHRYYGVLASACTLARGRHGPGAGACSGVAPCGRRRNAGSAASPRCRALSVGHAAGAHL